MVPKLLIEEIKLWIRERKYGYIQINFVQGRIPSWNVFSSIRSIKKQVEPEKVMTNGRKEDDRQS